MLIFFSFFFFGGGGGGGGEDIFLIQIFNANTFTFDYVIPSYSTENFI